MYPTDLYTGGGLLIDALPMLTKHHVYLWNGVTYLLWAYIHNCGLQRRFDGQYIVPDQNMAYCFGELYYPFWSDPTSKNNMKKLPVMTAYHEGKPGVQFMSTWQLAYDAYYGDIGKTTKSAKKPKTPVEPFDPRCFPISYVQ